MAVGWMKIFDTVTTLAQVGAQFRRPTDLAPGSAGSLEHRLAGVVVAALKEAFDRDRARMDLERETLEAERSRAERALAAELRRQAADRALNQLKLIAVFAGLVLLVSAVLAAWLGGMRSGIAAVLLGGGWALALAALGCVFAAWQQVSVWASATEPPPAGSSRLANIAPWFLLASLTFVAASLLMAS
ncbi:MAG TPA: hypothetical protein VGD94_07590 [Vicinamibacterales bacterium]